MNGCNNMPYIPNKERRKELDTISDQLVYSLNKIGIKGNLNYFLFRTFKHLWRNYADYSNWEGDCQGSLRELYRKLVAPYEDSKIEENGDIS